MEVLSKDSIEGLIVPYLSVGKRGIKVGVELWRIVWAILYWLKSGCQWRMLPLSVYFEGKSKLGWKGVYYHYRQWVRDGSFKRVWVELLRANPRLLDLSFSSWTGLIPWLKMAERM